ADYQPSPAAIRALAGTKIALLDGPSGSGRNTIIRRLAADYGYQQIISDTTRTPRMNNGVLEQNGVEYWFKAEEEVLDGLKNGDYIEAALIHEQQVSGVNAAEIRRIANAGGIAINDVQPDGVRAFITYKPDTVCIFMTPPSL